MTYEKIVTLYDTAEHAEAAKRSLESAGFSPSEISMINSKTLSMAGDKLREPGLWHRLFGRDIQQYEATVYGRSVEAGGVVLTVRVPENEVARATSILNSHRAIDLTKRAEQEGLLTAEPAVASKPAPAVRPAPATVATAGAMSGALSGGEEVLALAEEQINVGKRLVQEGTTRIRRFVTETPVETQVTLHEEHARVIRRAISDPNYVRNLDWTDKTIEITETVEEAVVTKSVHVAEEVVIQREGSDHVKTVKDKVRRQQVEVERLAMNEPVGKR
jgi:stress response protein YsnF